MDFNYTLKNWFILTSFLQGNEQHQFVAKELKVCASYSWKFIKKEEIKSKFKNNHFVNYLNLSVYKQKNKLKF